MKKWILMYVPYAYGVMKFLPLPIYIISYVPKTTFDLQGACGMALWHETFAPFSTGWISLVYLVCGAAFAAHKKL